MPMVAYGCAQSLALREEFVTSAYYRMMIPSPVGVGNIVGFFRMIWKRSTRGSTVSFPLVAGLASHWIVYVPAPAS